MVHVHGERDGFTLAALRGASTSASTAPCHGDDLPLNIIDVEMCVLHSAPLAARRRCRHRCSFTMGRQSSLSVDRSCASILSTTALAPVRHVGSGTHALHAQAAPAMLRVPVRLYYEHFVNVSELGDGVRTCHSAFLQVTGTVATH